MRVSRPLDALLSLPSAANRWLAVTSLRAYRGRWRLLTVAAMGTALALSVSEEADAVPQPRLHVSPVVADSIAAAGLTHRQLIAAFADLGLPEARTAPVIDAVERESRRFGVDPILVAAVIALENPDLNPTSVSPAGAVGIMQVMPQWGHSFRSRCGTDLTDIGTNVCFGVNVLQSHIDDARGSVTQGLLGYVGCVRDIACRRYPANVMRRWRDWGATAD